MSRKSRGAETQEAIAQWARDNGFVFAVSTGAGRTGRDVLNTPGISIEAKARTDFSPMAWIRQATQAADGDLPLVIFRCNGQGLKSLSEWPCMMSLATATQLLREAGYFPEVTE